MQDYKCFACDKKFRNLASRRLVDTRDDQLVYVGPDCYKRIAQAGDVGYRHPTGGPRLFLISEGKTK
jgi:hypothetical protein